MAYSDLLQHVSIRHPDCLFIDGNWVPPRDGGLVDITSPDTGAIVGRSAQASATDMDDAVAAARRAFDTSGWAALAPSKRAAFVVAMAKVLESRNAEIAAAWTAQAGALASFAPAFIADATAAIAATARLIDGLEFVKRVESREAAAALLIREPVGVVAAIAPWNSPYEIMLGKIIPALLAGCTVIMKPSPETPFEAYIIAEAAEQAGIPPGVLNLVPAERTASDALVRHPGVDAVSFTGSTTTGKHIGSVCAERIARCTLELGGKSPVIVLDDYDVEAAGKLLADTIIMMSGQICSMLTRVIVTRARHDSLVSAIKTHLEKVRVGFSTDPDTQMGPVANRRQLETVESYIARGIAEGATLVTGGVRAAGLADGFFMEPTLFANVDNDWAIAQEEIFGPVLSVIPCDDEADAVRIANASRYGLNASVLTNDAQAAYRIARATRTGCFGQNGLRADFALPFGGMKQSGIGREGGIEGIMTFLETKTVLLDAMPDLGV